MGSNCSSTVPNKLRNGRTKGVRMNPTIFEMMQLARLGGWQPKNFEDKLSGINIAKEYELIQKKQSKLSSTLRRQVVWRYEREKHENQKHNNI